MNRGKLKFQARKQLRKMYWPALLVCMISFIFNPIMLHDTRIPFTLVGLIANFLPFHLGIWSFIRVLLIMLMVQIFISGPLRVGKSIYFIRGIEGTDQINDLFFAFRRKSYRKIAIKMFFYLLILLVAIGAPVFITYFLFNIEFHLGLLGSLLTVPALLYGIRWSYRFRFVPYLIAEYPELSFSDTIHISMGLTEYIELKLLLLDISFAGWYIVGSLLFGLGIFLVRPYHEATVAQAYRCQTEECESFIEEVMKETRDANLLNSEDNDSNITETTDEIEEDGNMELENQKGGVIL